MTQIHHTGLTVSSLERALAFWSEALGMEVVMQQDRQGGYFERIVGEHGVDVRTAQLAFAGGGACIELFEFRSPRGGRSALRTADVGFSHVCVTTDDLDALLARLVAAGGEAPSEPVAVDSGANAGGRGVYVRDPDGHVLELFTPPPR
ncbi:MAG TPA: VOC family protein [Gaiellales bacterium]|jgi:catechol 2,3-dioxygenase-like lactoylglutathione lyase family enzyme|nr:VOC family protein [Gaiellales bacterium]